MGTDSGAAVRNSRLGAEAALACWGGGDSSWLRNGGSAEGEAASPRSSPTARSRPPEAKGSGDAAVLSGRRISLVATEDDGGSSQLPSSASSSSISTTYSLQGAPGTAGLQRWPSSSDSGEASPTAAPLGREAPATPDGPLKPAVAEPPTPDAAAAAVAAISPRVELLPPEGCKGTHLRAGVRILADVPPQHWGARAAWEALAIAALIGYLVVPFLMLGLLLLAAFTLHPLFVALAATLAATLLLPAGPLMFPPFIESPLLKALRLYFQFSITICDPSALGRPAIWAEYPHSVFPLSQLLAISLDPALAPGMRVHSVGASALFSVPLWRHMLGWLGMRPASRDEFEGLLLEHGAVKVQPGGIAEMYLSAPDAEVIKALDRRGFVRLAVKHGLPLIPTYSFGNSQLLVYGPKSLEALSRRLRVSVGFAIGRWGLPLLPVRVPLHMVVGPPVPVRCLPPNHPEFETAVEQAHAAYLTALREIYYTHRDAYGWGDRPLVMV